MYKFRFLYFTEIGGIMEGPFMCNETDRDELVVEFHENYGGCEPGYANLTILDFGESGIPEFTQDTHTNELTEEDAS